MINVLFLLSNPFIHGKFKNLGCKNFQLTEHKFCEVQLTHYSSDIVGFEFSLTFKTDHAGIRITATLLTFTAHFSIHDNRHWNSRTNAWMKYDSYGRSDEEEDLV